MQTVMMRGGSPAVYVKDETLWARHPEAGPLMERLPEDQVDAIYESIRETFWEHYAPEAAQAHGFDPSDIWQDGRSGGWLCLHAGFTSYIDLDETKRADEDDEYMLNAFAERDRFLAFAEAIEDEIRHCGDTFIEHLREAVADLDARREDCLVRGEN